MANTCRKKSLLCTQGLGLVFPGAGTSQPHWLSLPLSLPVLGKLWWSQRRACFPFAFAPSWEVWQGRRSQAHSTSILTHRLTRILPTLLPQVSKETLLGAKCGISEWSCLLRVCAINLLYTASFPLGGCLQRERMKVKSSHSWFLSIAIWRGSQQTQCLWVLISVHCTHSYPSGVHSMQSMGSHALFLT